MDWEVTYRARDGRQTIETFEADSRDAVFKAVAAKGMRAIRVKDLAESTPRSCHM